MARTRGFNEADAIHAAAELFTRHGYEGTSVDDLVSHLGIHRGSLYRTFGSKLALFHTALSSQIDRQILPWISSLGVGMPAAPGQGMSAALITGVMPGGGAPSVDLGLLLVAAIERAPIDPVAAAQVQRVFTALESTFRPIDEDGPIDEDDDGDGVATAFAATVFGLHLRMRAGLDPGVAASAAVALSRAVAS